MVSPASRMSSAISLGVFRRTAPSTSAIMRSRKDSPGLAVTRTTMRSDRTRVPPVTAERSPPDSRITGADSPVMADSSTVAIPSITSPSAGISSPAVTTTTSPATRRALGTSTREPSSSRLRATVSARVLRRLAACALPRPSAMASAKFAKRTVIQSHAAMSPAKRFACVDESPKSFTKRTVTTTLPTSTRNMTGFRATWRGSSFRKAPSAAERTMAGSKREVGLVVTAAGAPGSARARARAGR